MLAFVLMSTEYNVSPSRVKPDDSLLTAVAAGDTDSFEKLYRMTDRAVYAFALSILKNPSDAEDVMQQTFVSVYNSARTYRKGTDPMAWILTVARNHAFMHLRRQKRETVISPELIDDGNVLIFPSAQASIEDRTVLNAALEILGEDERQIVLLHAASGLKHREIAEFLSLPLSTVLSKYNRSLHKLKTHLQQR